MSKPRFTQFREVRHVATDKRYTIIQTPDKCVIEATGAPAYIYQRNDGYEIKWWVRPQYEMEDGRFAEVPEE